MPRDPERAGTRASVDGRAELGADTGVAAPADPRQDRVAVDPGGRLGDLREHRLDELVGEQPRLQPEREQGVVARVVVVLLELDARVLDVVDPRLVAEGRRGVAYALRQLEHREDLGELVEDTELALAGRVLGG